ncbi:MAG: hypothetical protein IPK84_03970 [Candidatus Moraniibacteriota bacterium]|nr:MAG: hypothetical protein IPK84_03970 [Candidatus Moranbacteria bacterium]
MAQRPDVAFSDFIVFSAQASTALAAAAWREWIKHLDVLASCTGVKTCRWARANGLNRIGQSRV